MRDKAILKVILQY